MTTYFTPRVKSKQAKQSNTICIVTCYKQPDYVRAVTLRRGLVDTGLFDNVIIVKNKSSGIKRYLEVFLELVRVRFISDPNIYLITFRGYEILPLVLLLAAGRKIIYDEFINPVEWFVYEHKKFSERSVAAHVLKECFRSMMRRCAVILADTSSHAQYSSRLMNIPLTKFQAIPVGTDELVFTPRKQLHKGSKGPFRVLYYGNMIPLHGIEYVIETAVELANRRDIEFHIVGGKKDLQSKVRVAKNKGAHIRYDAWIDFDELPALFAASDICLAGPFGGTLQSQYVITGKTYQFMASARPVIIGDTKESNVFTDKKNALIVPQANTQALKDAIEWAYNHPVELKHMGENGRILYEQMFSAKRIENDLRVLFMSKHLL